jgi:hypothetical protein
VLIDLAVAEEANDALTEEFLAMVRYQKDKISAKKRPTVFLRADKRISQIDAGLINANQAGFSLAMQKEHDLTAVKSMRELADSIAKYNSTLNDTTIVYCQGEGEDDLSKESTKAAVRLMRQESLNPILVIKDKELAQTARMEPGKFYVYYKPSFINGFEAYMEKDINFAYLQALEGVCRDDFSLNEAFINSDEFKN